MQFLDIGPDARGVVAIGQFATGIVAVGQVAHGVVAVGPIAVGIVAVGPIAVGGFTVGGISIGLYGALGVLGVGGQARGWVIPLVPGLGPPRDPPPVQTLAALKGRRPGWIEVDLEAGKTKRGGSRVVVFEGKTRLREARLDARVRRGALAAAPETVYARVRHSEAGPVLDELRRRHVSRLIQPIWWLIWAAQVAGLVVVAAIVWAVAVEPLFP